MAIDIKNIVDVKGGKERNGWRMGWKAMWGNFLKGANVLHPIFDGGYRYYLIVQNIWTCDNSALYFMLITSKLKKKGKLGHW